MATTLKLRRGTTAQHSSFTGAAGEVTVDTDKETVVVHDGSTAGGFPLAKENGTTFTNVDINSGAIDNTTIGGATAAAITGTTITANTSVSTDTISEKTSAAGVTVDGVVLKDNGASLGGNLTFTGTGNRITGDMSNATLTNRLFFQNSVTNGGSQILMMPNGTGTSSSFIGYNSSDPTNASLAALQVIGSTDVRVQSTITGTGTYLPITFYTGGSERMRIDTSGNVGIGTSSPGSKLNIYDASNTSLNVDGDSTTAIRAMRASADTSQAAVQIRKARGTVASLGAVSTGDAVGTLAFQAYGGSTFRNTATVTSFVETYTSDTNIAGSLIFATNAGATAVTERMRIDSNGNLMVGTTTAFGKTNFIGSGTTSTAPVVYANNNSGSVSAWTFYSRLESSSNSANAVHFGGITAGVNAWYLLGNGTSTWSSDARLKKNIETTRDGYLQDLCQLRVVKYNWHNHEDTAPKELGLIAQEVEQVFPGLVQDDLQGEVDGVTYKTLKGSVLPYMLLKAIQELKAELDTVKAELATLKG